MRSTVEETHEEGDDLEDGIMVLGEGEEEGSDTGMVGATHIQEAAGVKATTVKRACSAPNASTTKCTTHDFGTTTLTTSATTWTKETTGCPTPKIRFLRHGSQEQERSQKEEKICKNMFSVSCVRMPPCITPS